MLRNTHCIEGNFRQGLGFRSLPGFAFSAPGDIFAIGIRRLDIKRPFRAGAELGTPAQAASNTADKTKMVFIARCGITYPWKTA
jgi:hypothetical protein